MREINLSLIMQHLLQYELISRATLAVVTGLNKSTVSSLVQELLDRRFVREMGLRSVGVGRPSMQLELNPNAGIIVSAELGVDFISVICADFGVNIVWRHKELTPPGITQPAILERLMALLHRAISEGSALCPHCGGLLGLAVGVPGLVDESSGKLLFAPNLRWENVPLLDILKQEFGGVPIFVDNEANLAALGENLFGAGKGYHEVLFVSAGVGLGGAVVRDGQLARGTTGFAGEFGHMTMDPNGERCNCGNRGCWETQVSQSALFRAVRAALDSGQTSLIPDLCPDGPECLTVPVVVEAARQGDAVARDALARVGHALGTGIASLINALNPDLVVLGGILSLAGEFLLASIEQEIQARALRWNAAATHVILAKHGFDTCVMGGVAILFQTIVMQPALYPVPVS